MVDPAPTTTGLGSNHNPSVHGQPVTFTASVAGNIHVRAPRPEQSTSRTRGRRSTRSRSFPGWRRSRRRRLRPRRIPSRCSTRATATTRAAPRRWCTPSSQPGRDDYGRDLQMIRRHPAPTPSAPRLPSPPTSWSPPLASASPPAPSTSRTGPRSSAAAPSTARVTPLHDHRPGASARTRSKPYTRTTPTSSTSTSPGITQTVGKATPDGLGLQRREPVDLRRRRDVQRDGDGIARHPDRDGHLQVRRCLHRHQTASMAAATPASTLTLLDAGTHVITATYNGNASYTSATSPDLAGGQEVDPATLTVTAANKSRAYGAANPAFTVGYTGFVNSETLATSGVTGAPSCSTSATPTSPVAGSPYTITCGYAAAWPSTNYTFAFVNGQLTVTASTSTTVVVSDHHPSVWGQSVTFTATISGFGSGTATGTVNFVIDGTAPQTADGERQPGHPDHIRPRGRLPYGDRQLPRRRQRRRLQRIAQRRADRRARRPRPRASPRT